MKKPFFNFLMIIFFLLIFSNFNFAQIREKQVSEDLVKNKEEVLEGEVTKILEEKTTTPANSKNLQFYQKIEILITKGSLENKKITVENGSLSVANLQKYKVGDEVIINYHKDFQGKDSFYITDYVRRRVLFWLLLFFLTITIVIGGWQGLSSLIGMGFSFLIIFLFILPKIYSGFDPVQTAIFGLIVVIPFTFFLSHGINKKTIVAIVGTLISLVITGILASIYVEATKLTGFVSEEAGFLQIYKPGLINMKGLLLAGIIIGTLGVLDDITISQAAIVWQLKKANFKLKKSELYQRAIKVGKDHIASMINTLILVYTGSALPLLLIFINNPKPFTEIINYEIIAEEIVKTLVGSIGLILAVPITTFIASWVSE